MRKVIIFHEINRLHSEIPFECMCDIWRMTFRNHCHAKRYSIFVVNGGNAKHDRISKMFFANLAWHNPILTAIHREHSTFCCCSRMSLRHALIQFYEAIYPTPDVVHLLNSRLTSLIKKKRKEIRLFFFPSIFRFHFIQSIRYFKVTRMR